MTLFAFLLSAACGGGAVVAWRERSKVAAAIGLVATAICLLASVVMPMDASLTVGPTTLQVDPYVRLFLLAISLTLLVSQIVGLAHGWQRELPLATLGALGLVGVALTVGTPAAAMLAVAAAGTFVVIASLERAISMPAVRAAASGFRLAAIAGFMGLVAMAITGDDPIFVAPDVLAGATLLMAAGVAIRVGAIPLHAPVARLIERARTAALPLLAAWVPAAFAVVALGWTSTIVAIGATTPIVFVIVALGLLTIALASTVVLIDDDLIRWLGYGVIADGGFVLLALAGDSLSATSAGLAWLICFALARSIVACVLLGFQGAFDARRTRELEGWLRRTPILGVALLGALVIGFGLPGTIPWQVRLDLAEGALGQPLGLALIAVALLPLVPMARLAWNGIRPVGDVVAAGKSERYIAPPRTAGIVSGDEAVPAEATGAGSEAAPPEAAVPQSLVVAPEAAAAPGSLVVAPEAAAPEALPSAPEALPASPEPASPTSETPIPDPAVISRAAVTSDAEAVSGTIWATTDARASAETARDASPATTEATVPPEGEAPAGSDVATAPESPVPVQRPAGPVEAEPLPAKTLSSSGRAVRAARKAGQPTIVATTQPDAEAAPTSDGGGEGSGTGGTSGAPSPTRPSRRESLLASARRARTSASVSAQPLRHALRDLPAVWALDRTLVASLATLLLALVGLAFATDLVGLGSAAGLATLATPAPSP